jgi:hypothetical protein
MIAGKKNRDRAAHNARASDSYDSMMHGSSAGCCALLGLQTLTAGLDPEIIIGTSEDLRLNARPLISCQFSARTRRSAPGRWHSMLPMIMSASVPPFQPYPASQHMVSKCAAPAGDEPVVQVVPGPGRGHKGGSSVTVCLGLARQVHDRRGSCQCLLGPDGNS